MKLNVKTKFTVYFGGLLTALLLLSAVSVIAPIGLEVEVAQSQTYTPDVTASITQTGNSVSYSIEPGYLGDFYSYNGCIAPMQNGYCPGGNEDVYTSSAPVIKIYTLPSGESCVDSRSNYPTECEDDLSEITIPEGTPPNFVYSDHMGNSYDPNCRRNLPPVPTNAGYNSYMLSCVAQTISGSLDYTSGQVIEIVAETYFSSYTCGNATCNSNSGIYPIELLARFESTDFTSFELTCGVDQYVTQGESANYTLSATVSSGYTSTINVTMSSDPTGATMTTSPVVLSPASLPLPYTGTAVVPTSGLTAGTYTLTFAGNDGTGTKTCQAHLTVAVVSATSDLKFNGSDGPTSPTPSTGSTGTLTWTTENAASCTGSMQQGADTSSPAWIGARSEANLEEQTFNVTGLQSNTTYIFKIECVNSLGQAGTPDTVEVNVSAVPQEPTATLECMGESNKHPTDGPCTVAIGGSGLLFWDSSYASSCSIDPDFGSVATSETDGQSTGARKTNTTYTLTCEGASGTTPATDSVEILVEDETASSPPNPPIVAADNTTCGVVTVSWTPGETPPDITDYVVFNSTTSSSGPWDAITGPLAASVTSFPHTTTTASNNYYMVRSYNGVTPSSDSNAVLSNSISCAPVLDASDKDVYKVDGKIDKTFSPTACSGVSEIASFSPVNALFSEGDIVTFKINVCNSGTQALTGVSVTDTLEKLTEPSTPTSSCTLTNYNYDGNKTMTFNLSDVPAKDPNSSLPSVCSVTFTAKVTAPGTATAALYRFQNIADIRTNELSEKRVMTPPYLFSITGGIPDRTETAPQ